MRSSSPTSLSLSMERSIWFPSAQASDCVMLSLSGEAIRTPMWTLTVH